MNAELPIEDLRAHVPAFRKAIEIAREQAPPDIDDKAYWSHELEAFDRVMAALGANVREEPLPEDPDKRMQAILDRALRKVRAATALGAGYEGRFRLTTLEPSEQAVLAFAEFNGQVSNGGLAQYVSNGYAAASGTNGKAASEVVRRMARVFREEDPELADSVIDCCKAVEYFVDRPDMADGEEAEEEFREPQARYFEFDDGRLARFFLAAAEGLDPESAPFRDGVRKAPAEESAPGM